MKFIELHFNRYLTTPRHYLLQSSMGIKIIGIMGLLVLAFLIQQLIHLNKISIKSTDQINTLKSLLKNHQNVVVKPALPESKILALNHAIHKLNFPWEIIFEQLEQTPNRKVAILTLDGNAEKNNLSLTVETANPEKMLDYVAFLKKQLIFKSVYIRKHEIDKKDPNAPYIFQLEIQIAEDL